MKTVSSRQGVSRSRTRGSGQSYRVALTGPLDRHEREALQVEIRVLAKRHGVTIRDISVGRSGVSVSG